AATINAANLTLRVTSSGAPVTSTVSYDAASHAATLMPNAALSASPVSHTATVSSAVKDVAGNALAASFEFAFTTTALDNVPPAVTAVLPASAATNVPVTSLVKIT